MTRISALLATLVVTVAGCQSFSSTMLNRLDDNSFKGNSNGLAQLFRKARPYKGIPITLQVPSHLDVYIDESYYMTIDPKQSLAIDLLKDTRILDVRTEIIKSAKVFTVDFKRPGAGTLNLDLEFTDEQYFDKITSDLEDRTIKETGELIAQVITSVKALSTSARSPNEEEIRALEDRQIRKDARVVAYQRFDINAVDFEYQVLEFVNRHLNCCNECGTMPTYDQTPSATF